MPVARGPQINARSAVLVGVTGVVVALLLVGAVLWVADSGGDVEVRLGDSDFDAGDAVRLSEEIAENGPLLFADVAGGSRDLIVTHTGTDPEVGWLAFDARRPGDPRDCFFEWRGADAVFVNTCDADDVVPADGAGLRQYPVTVDDGGDVRVDINAGDGDETDDEDAR